MGRGVPAAALMGRLRTAIQAYTLEGLPAGPLLERLSVFLDTAGRRRYTTLCYAVYDPAGHRLELANAGHLPPLLSSPSGRARLLPVHHGLPLGVDAAFAYAGQTFSVPPGSSLLFYTDGLVEDRGRPLADRLGALCDALSGCTDPEELCERAMSVMAPPDGGDDVALLALHHPRAAR
ncbi:PP2C family protein-serine/threonine phosphatase [Actinomadura luzonensis]|uniref:PP2C family protein-serine/threonine phosphatase n=1 Tax=Actinomadura luzonensis TaxID=2805427 RepID=UPI0038993C63